MKRIDLKLSPSESTVCLCALSHVTQLRPFTNSEMQIRINEALAKSAAEKLCSLSNGSAINLLPNELRILAACVDHCYGVALGHFDAPPEVFEECAAYRFTLGALLDRLEPVFNE